jgi:glutamate/tyrosine decarboxylase-like PLP-dependent enzyme
VHKYGYTFKGASLIMYRDRSMLRHQRFFYDDWPGGLYGSVTTAGTRPAAPIAGAWAAINFLGADGYLAKARQVRDATRIFRDEIDGIDGLAVRGKPDMSVFELGADAGSAIDIGGVGDVMDERGWHLDRQPGGLHLMVSPFHHAVADRFAADLRDAVEHHQASAGRAATYGGVVEP